MRAALVEVGPHLSSRFGLHPWDYGRLSVEELNAYLAALQSEG